MTVVAMTGDGTRTGLPAPLRNEAAAAVLVAESFSAAPPPLGLGVALPLRGGGHRARGRLRSELGFAWQTELRAAIADGIRRQDAAGACWLTLPPMLLCGPEGVGRTHAARRLAAMAELPHVGVAVGGPLGIEQLRPSACGPDLLLPSAPVLAMAISRCANPVVSVQGVDALDLAGQAELARMIDPETAGRWPDYACGATVDLRHVNWMIQAQEPEALIPPLLRVLRPVRLRFPEGPDLPLHLAEVLAEAAVDMGVIDRVGGRAEDGLAHLARLPGGPSTGRLYAAARQWLGAHFR